MEEEMNSLLYPAIGVVTDIFSAYEPMPFGLEIEEFTNFAITQFTKRLSRLEKARQLTSEEIDKLTEDFDEVSSAKS